MIVFSFLGKNPGGQLFLETYNQKRNGKQQEIAGNNPQFLRIGLDVLVCTDKTSVIIDAETYLARSLTTNWKRGLGRMIKEITEENVVYDQDFYPIK